MVSYSRSLVVLSVAAALAVPATLAAQTAIPRTGGSTSSGSSGGSSGGGGSTTSSGGGGGVESSSRVSPPSMPSFPTDSRRPSGSSSSRTGSSSRGGSVDRGEGPVGPGTNRGSSAVERGSSMVPANGSSVPYGGSRTRGDRPLVGSAVERPIGAGTPNYNLYFPIDPFSPWGRWYPWYYGGFGYGYLSFDPWRYGTSRYSMYRYGASYNPYDPWCYGVGYWLCDPWGGATTSSYGGSGGGRASSSDEPDEAPTASIRLRVSPASAKVYVNGALVGTVADFSGLTGHLKVTLGQHLVEIKADGYETFVPKVELEAGRTTTVRGSLKKQ